MKLDREALEQRLHDYLDGLLGPAETRETERMLAQPEVSQMLAEAIVLRELLTEAPIAGPPEGLADRIADRMGLDAEPPTAAEPPTDRAPSPARGAIAGASWAVKGHRSGPGASGAWAGVGTMGYTLGPLAPQARRQHKPRPTTPIWWRLGRRLTGGNR